MAEIHHMTESYDLFGKDFYLTDTIDVIKNSEQQIEILGIQEPIYKANLEELNQEIKSKYVDDNIFSRDKDDIRMKIFNYENPLAERTIHNVNFRITDGLIRNKRKTYLLYSDSKIIGESYSVDNIKLFIKHIENNFLNTQKVEEPKILYHGSISKFSEFDENRISTGESGDLFGKGFYLTDNKNVAKHYAHQIALKEYIIGYQNTGILGTQEPIYQTNAQELATEKEIINSFEIRSGKLLNAKDFIIDASFQKTIVDIISNNLYLDKDSINKSFDYLKKNKSIIKDYRGELTYVFNNIIAGDDSTKQQIISHIKELGYDGVIYPSDLNYERNEALNYVIYNKNILNPHIENTKEMSNNINQSKFEHFRNQIEKNLEYAENLDADTMSKFSSIISQVKEFKNYQTNPTAYTFTNLKDDLQSYFKSNEPQNLSSVQKQRLINFVKMAQFQPQKQFKVFPLDKNFTSEIPQKNQTQFLTFDDFKKQISLPDFMELYGFKNSKGGTRNNPKMKNENTGEVFIIKKNEKGHFTFFDPVNELYKGATIIDFVMDKHKNENNKPFTLQDVAPILTNYIHGKHYVKPEISNYKIAVEKIDANKMVKEIHGLKPYTEKSFLHQRGISDAIIDLEMWKNKIFNTEYVNENTGAKHINTAFPVQAIDGKIVAISKRNNGFKGIQGEKSIGVFISSDPSSGTQLDKLIICESAVDCISHYQLNQEQLKDTKVRYISTEGDFSEEQVNIISKVINKQQPKEIMLGQDNDLAGAYEVTKILKHLKLHNEISATNIIGEDISIITHKSKQESFIEFSLKNKNQYNEFKNELEKFIQKANVQLEDITGEKQAFTIIEPITNLKDENVSIRVDMQNHQYTWEHINQFIIDTKYKELKLDIVREKPINNDFNDDLKASVQPNISKEEKVIEPITIAPNQNKLLEFIKEQHPQNINFETVPVSEALIKDIATVLKTDEEKIDFWIKDNTTSKNYYLTKFVDTLTANKEQNLEMIQKYNTSLIGYDMSMNIKEHQKNLIKNLPTNITLPIGVGKEYKREIPPLKLYSKLTSDYDTVDFKTIYIATDSKFFYKSYDTMLDVNNLQESKWEQITNEMYNKLSTYLHTENMIVYPFSDLKGELNGQSTKIYIGKDLQGEIYQSSGLLQNPLNTSQWKPISQQEYEKLGSILSEKFYNRTQEDIDKIYNTTYKNFKIIEDGKKCVAYLDNNGKSGDKPIESMPENIYQQHLEKANKIIEQQKTQNNISL